MGLQTSLGTEYALFVGEIALALVVILLYSLNRGNLRQTSSIYSGVTELHRGNQDQVLKLQRIVFDYGVRLEILEFGAKRAKSGPSVAQPPQKEAMAPRLPGRDVTVMSHHASGSTEAEILVRLQSGAKTAREIRTTLGRSREHTARTLKRLFEDGLVVRESETRPYMYSLTEKGRGALEGGLLTG